MIKKQYVNFGVIIMKLFKNILTACVLILGTSSSYSSTVITFDIGYLDFMTLNNQLHYNQQGGNHIFVSGSGGGGVPGEIIFNEPLIVNSFELNAEPWVNYSCSSYPSNYPIQGVTEQGEIAFSLNVDLTGYDDWDKWLLVETESLTSIKRLIFGPNDQCFPSVDNLTINGPEQIISVNNTPKGFKGKTSVLEVAYDTSDNNNQLSGLGMRVHFDSSLLSFKEITGLIEQDIIAGGEGPFSDDVDFDSDPLTDQYMLFGWASLYNNWPNTNLPTILMNIAFDVSENIDTQAISSTNINFSKSSFTSRYELISESYELEILNDTWDFDDNGQADALTDGLMMIRYLFGLRDDFVTNNAIASNSSFDSQQVIAEIENSMGIADIDADGGINALTDGLLLLRYLFELPNVLLTIGVVGQDATRTSIDEIQSYIGAHMPAI